MINQAITDLNELAELLDEVSTMVDNLNPATAPVQIAVEEVDIIFDLAPITEHDASLPRNAKIVSMVQNFISPKKFTSFRFCTSPNTLTATINISP